MRVLTSARLGRIYPALPHARGFLLTNDFGADRNMGDSKHRRP